MGAGSGGWPPRSRVGSTGYRRRMSDSPVPPWAASLATPERLAAFVGAVERYFQLRGTKATVNEGVVNLGEGEEAERRYGLTNVLQMCAGSPEEEWPGLVASHFDTAQRVQERAQEIDAVADDFDKISAMLRIRLFDAGSLGPVANHAVAREDIPGVFSVLMFDLPEGSQSVPRDMAAKWSRSDADLLGLALKNVRDTVPAQPRLITDQDPDGAWCLETDSIYGSSLALGMEEFAEMLGAFGAYVTMPLRNLVIAQPLNDSDQFQRIAGLSMFAAKLDADGPGSMSPRVWWFRAGVWIHMPYEIGEESISLSPPQEWIDLLEGMS